MTVERLIELLTHCENHWQVIAFDGNSDDLEEVTGVLVSVADGTVELQTDEP